MIEGGLDATTGSVERLADEIGVGYSTLWSWKCGLRNPSPKNLHKLAAVLRRRSKTADALADELDRAASTDRSNTQIAGRVGSVYEDPR